ncbi:MAG: hypothetical protein GY705_18710 [Bacteroidetes bacterium]|nr:hypothetical protein [Bacteroidota bacterium]
MIHYGNKKMRKSKVHHIIMCVLMIAVIIDVAALAVTSDIRCIYTLGGIAVSMLLSTVFLEINHNSLIDIDYEN